jgi:hypothetical protein
MKKKYLSKNLTQHIMAKKKNKNIIPIRTLEQLKDEVSYSDFAYKKDFTLICKLLPNVKEEKIEIEVIDNVKINLEGLVYVFVIEDKIFKIGHTITTIKKRIQSYNCGKTEYRINGTNSTTNYFVLQSILLLNLKVDIFAFYPDQPQYTLFGKSYQDSHPASKRAENIILTDFVKLHQRKPIGCTQV